MPELEDASPTLNDDPSVYMFRGVIEGWRGWSVPKRGCMLMDEAYDSPPVFQTCRCVAELRNIPKSGVMSTTSTTSPVPGLAYDASTLMRLGLLPGPVVGELVCP